MAGPVSLMKYGPPGVCTTPARRRKLGLWWRSVAPGAISAMYVPSTSTSDTVRPLTVRVCLFATAADGTGRIFRWLPQLTYDDKGNCFEYIYKPEDLAKVPDSVEEQSRHIAYVLAEATARRARTVEASEAAENEWVDTVIRVARFGREFLESCTPGYYNNEGHVSEDPSKASGTFFGRAQNGRYGGGRIAVVAALRSDSSFSPSSTIVCRAAMATASGGSSARKS